MNNKDSAVKRLTKNGLAMFNSLKKLMIVDCINGVIDNVPSDGDILEEALRTLLSKKINKDKANDR